MGSTCPVTVRGGGKGDSRQMTVSLRPATNFNRLPRMTTLWTKWPCSTRGLNECHRMKVRMRRGLGRDSKKKMEALPLPPYKVQCTLPACLPLSEVRARTEGRQIKSSVSKHSLADVVGPGSTLEQPGPAGLPTVPSRPPFAVKTHV